MRRITLLVALVVATLLPLALPVAGAEPPDKDCTATSTGRIPLTELAGGSYQGFPGGLYPGGSNAPPPEHRQAGLELAHTLRPLGPDGQPDDPDGRIVLLALGMSNAMREFGHFQGLLATVPGLNPALVAVNGAQGGWSAQKAADPTSLGWDVVDERLAAAGVTPEQVQVVWIKQGHASPSLPFPYDALQLRDELLAIAQVAHARYPNLRLAYLTSRIYAGYATGPLNPEPYAYQSGFAVKWLIEAQLAGDPALYYDPAKGAVRVPWLAWGPYLWADGLVPRDDGLIWRCDDFEPDGLHPAFSGRQKVAGALLAFFQSDPTTVPWFYPPAPRDQRVYLPLVALPGATP